MAENDIEQPAVDAQNKDGFEQELEELESESEDSDEEIGEEPEDSDEEVEAKTESDSSPEKKTRKKSISRIKWAFKIVTRDYDPESPYWRHVLKSERDYLELSLSFIGSAARAAEAAGVSFEFYTSRLRAHGISPRLVKIRSQIKSPKDDNLI